MNIVGDPSGADAAQVMVSPGPVIVACVGMPDVPGPSWRPIASPASIGSEVAKVSVASGPAGTVEGAKAVPFPM